MTTYTLPGFVMQESADETTVTGISYAQIQFVVPDATVGFSTRVIGRSFDDDEDLLALEIDDYVTLLNDENVDNFSELDLTILNVSSPSGTGIVANPFDNAANRSYVFRLDGNPVPDSALTSPAAINAFLGTITVTPPAPGSGFEPGDFIRFDSLSDIIITQDDDIPGTPFDDILDGGLGDDMIDGAGGNDTLRGGDGNDRLFGSAGNDILDGGAGARDRAVYNESFGAATFTFEGDRLFVDLIDSGDLTSYRDTLTNIELLEFSDRTVTVSSLRPAEEVTGDDGVDDITTGGGDDVVDGGGGDDMIDAGSGDDRVSGGSGADIINGGDGADTVNGGDGTDTIDGGTSVDDLSDTIFGGNGDDVLRGGYGNDFIYGMDGNDSIAGGFGSDELYGQNDDDVITGSALSDLVFGGAGDDF
ncbi:calcium-binding protein, partial [Aestuariivita sp.]|uniref:calcium-binding protein n=1 Tax=Aestuariivita sp. TaxID=1872407 RepID=UPI002172D3FD